MRVVRLVCSCTVDQVSWNVDNNACQGAKKMAGYACAGGLL